MKWIPVTKSQHKPYRQLTHGQRYQIQTLHRKGFSQRSIAEAIGVHHSSLSRELKRNSILGIYCAKTANQLKDKRKLSAINFRKSDDNHGVVE